MPPRESRARTTATCVLAAVVVFVAGLALFNRPAPIVHGVRLIGEELSAHGGYASSRVVAIVAIVLVVAIWAGWRRTPLAIAWGAAIGAGGVPFVVAALNPSAAGADTTAAIAALIAAMTAALTFLGVAVVGTVVDTVLTRRDRRTP